MKRTGLRLFTAVMLFGLAADAAVRAESPAIVEHYPGAAFESTPAEAAGWSAEKLAEAKSWSQQIAPSAAVMIVQHGLVVAQWGDVAAKSNLHSVRKSLLSALIGIAVDEHKINLGATMESLGIDDNTPGLTPIEKTATVGDLLKSRSGIYHAALYETPGMARRRPARGSHPPGTFWYYNNWDFNALGTIYERATGDWIFTALQSRIARPIGMEDYQPGDGEYFNGKASEHPGYPIRMSARDLARFALSICMKDDGTAGRSFRAHGFAKARNPIPMRFPTRSGGTATDICGGSDFPITTAHRWSRSHPAPSPPWVLKGSMPL